jgi:hypothetical protein
MIYKILLTLLLLSMMSYASDQSDYSDERGMTKLLGPETYLRCSNFLADPKAKTYELSYKRTSTMPLSPFAGEYEPKFLPEIAWAGSKQVFTMDVLNENVNDGNQGTQMDALGHFGYTDKFGMEMVKQTLDH